MEEIVICKHCNQPEWWGELRWLNGKCMCRNCYKSDWEHASGRIYEWSDLDGRRPSRKEWEQQEGERSTCND